MIGVLFKVIILVFISLSVFSAESKSYEKWTLLKKEYTQIKKEQKTEGFSYMISGGLALLSGMVGQSAAEDPFEQASYTAFQTIGVAALGYGMYRWKLGNDDTAHFDYINDARFLTNKQKYFLYQKYLKQKEDRKKKERFIAGLSHLVVGVINTVSANNQKNDGLKESLQFVGVLNLLVSVNYLF